MIDGHICHLDSSCCDECLLDEGFDIDTTTPPVTHEDVLLAEVKRLREELRVTQSNFSMVRNALANQYPEIEEAIWKVIE